MLIPSRALGFIRAGLNGHYGVTLAGAPVGGDFDPLISYTGVWTEPEDPATEVFFLPETLPLQGDFFLYSDSSYTHGPITGSDPWTVRVYYIVPGDLSVTEASGSPATITDTDGSGGTSITVPAGSLTLTGYAPIVQATVAISVPAGALTLTGYAPSVSIEAAISVPAGSLTITGYAPLVVTTAGVTIDVPAGTLTVTGYAPTVYTQGSTTGAVFYLPLRFFSSASSGAVDPTSELDNLRSLLPRQPQAAVNPDGTFTAPWYRFFDYDVNTVRGGPSAPTMADVLAAIEAALSAIQAQQQATALIAQQAQTNAEALAATVEVVNNNALTGAGSIPPVSTSYLEP